MVRITSFLPATAAMRWQERLARLPLACCWPAQARPGANAWLILAPDPAMRQLGALLFLIQASPVPVACITRHPHMLAAAAPHLPRLAMLLSDTLDDPTLTQALRLLPAMHAGCMTLGYES
jgi:hypothetical protein